MTSTVPDILSRIVDHKRSELRQVSVAELEKRARIQVKHRRNFRAALDASSPAIIAEIKKASPSKGVLHHDDFNPARIASEYQSGGAAALSVLTDSRFFQGSLADLEAARGAARLPVLRKDFTLNEYHVVEAAAHGSDAILLIAAILSVQQMSKLRALAGSYEMASLVEVHNADELEAALSSGAEIVGVNNRNLHTFEVALETSLDLASKIPDTVLKVSESGIQERGHIDLLQGAGYRAFLIGEHLMKASSPSAAVRSLLACS
jgi:indole-3-glycerol phosphate synthase